MKKTVTLLLLVAAFFFVGCAQKQGTAKVVMETTAGTMEFLLYGETPKHRDNFIKLAGEQYFDSLLFHRVIKDFMIQGGDPDSKYAEPGVRLGEGGPDYRLDAEFRTPQLLHKRGALAAAQTPQIFRREIMLEVLRRVEEEHLTVTDDCSAAVACGYDCRIVPGSADNMKITSPSDLARAERIAAAFLA